MKRVKRSKKQDERNVNDPFMTLHIDMNVEILMKLPAGSIARLRFASKHLSSIILGKEFTELYKTRSSTQPRHLVSSVSCSVDPYGPCLASYDFTPPVRGLIFGRNCSKIVVGNPSTVNDVYKVLCMTVVTKRSNISRGVTPCDAMPEVHQVITLGAKEKWRMIESSYKGKRSLMRFDLSSEDFNVTKLPKDRALQWFGELVNHAGKITIAALRCGPVDLWVLEDVNKEVWSKTVVVVPSLPDRFGMSHKFVFKGILGTGEMIFAPMTSPSLSPNPFFFSMLYGSVKGMWDRFDQLGLGYIRETMDSLTLKQFTQM
uniref:F-box associated beta-propeller type 3 domain-containing protein n=1 Tax=Brassica oleracea var. oleracea TaxID=109376 RepID=A0A0D3ADI6_BRAOL